MEGSPWPEYQNGRQLSLATMAKLLKPFDIRPRTIRTASGTPKGYLRQDFEEAWSRYCRSSADAATAEVPCEAQHPPQASIHGGEKQNLEPPQPASVADAKPSESPSSPTIVADVAVAEPTTSKKKPRSVRAAKQSFGTDVKPRRIRNLRRTRVSE
jgi:Protein of unknown function (DUF3631)